MTARTKLPAWPDAIAIHGRGLAREGRETGCAIAPSEVETGADGLRRVQRRTAGVRRMRRFDQDQHQSFAFSRDQRRFVIVDQRDN